jgi:predicted amidophosphoribosyltransferase
MLGLSPSQKNKNDEEVDISRIKMAMAQPGAFVISDRCYWLRWEIESYITIVDKNGDPKYTEFLAQLLLKTIESFMVSEDLTLIPIPSAPQKIRQRGFDSITNLCTNIAQERKAIKIDSSKLYLRRTVVDQVGLTASQRQTNLAGVFGMHETINGTVVIVDDVITTGATLNSAARALKYAGAQRIFALALCGTPRTR